MRTCSASHTKLRLSRKKEEETKLIPDLMTAAFSRVEGFFFLSF